MEVIVVAVSRGKYSSLGVAEQSASAVESGTRRRNVLSRRPEKVYGTTLIQV
jgi:hypothetical protein